MDWSINGIVWHFDHTDAQMKVNVAFNQRLDKIAKLACWKGTRLF